VNGLALFGPVDSAHPAFTQRFQNAIGTDLRSGGQLVESTQQALALFARQPLGGD
jgi:hypothetical protein